jgi:hypothetical protein
MNRMNHRTLRLKLARISTIVALATSPGAAACGGEEEPEAPEPEAVITIGAPGELPAGALTPRVAELIAESDSALVVQPRVFEYPTISVVAERTPRVRVDTSDSCSISLTRATIARGVEHREPYGTSGPFRATGEPVYLHLEVDNPTGAEREMTIRWRHRSSDHLFTQTLEAGDSPRWRTWVYHRIWEDQTGDWEVEILDPSGCRIGEIAFTSV